MSTTLYEVAVIGGLVLAGIVKWGLKYGWQRLIAPKGRHGITGRLLNPRDMVPSVAANDKGQSP